MAKTTGRSGRQQAARSAAAKPAPRSSISEGKPAPKGMVIAPRGSGSKGTPKEYGVVARKSAAERLLAKNKSTTGKRAPKK